MPSSAAPPRPIARGVARGRPAVDPACAGCAQLGVFRALRRAGLEVQGGPGCDPGSAAELEARQGTWAAVAGAAPAIRDAAGVLSRARAAGARLVVVADRAPGAAAKVEAALRLAGASVVSLDPTDLAGAEAAMRRAASCDGAAVVALSACTRGARPSAPFAVVAARCNRCGACLSLGCPAISDPGGEAMVVDEATCTGCGLCAPLCRGRAIQAERR